MTLKQSLDVTLNGEKHEVFMSFGLLNLLSTLVNSPEKVPLIPLDPETRNVVLASCFAKRKKSGKVEAEVDMEDLDVSIEDAEKTLEFVIEHLTAFFVRALKRVLAATDANKEELASLGSSLNGLKASTSGTA